MSTNNDDVAKLREVQSDRYLGKLRSIHGHYDRAKIGNAILDLDG